MEWIDPDEEQGLFEYSHPLVPPLQHSAPEPLPALVRVNSIVRSLVEQLQVHTDLAPGSYRLTHCALGRQCASRLQRLQESHSTSIDLPTQLRPHLSSLRARTVISKTPPWFTAHITFEIAAPDEPYTPGEVESIDTHLDLAARPALLRTPTRADYEDDLRLFPRNLAQVPDWFLTDLLAPTHASDIAPIKSVVRRAAQAACHDEIEAAAQAFAELLDQSMIAAPPVLAFATRAVTYAKEHPHPPAHTHKTDDITTHSLLGSLPSLVATSHPSMRSLSSALLPRLVDELRAELADGRNGDELVTQSALTTAMLTACGLLHGSAPETIERLCDQAFADYDLPENAEYFALTLTQMREHHAVLFHAWAVSAIIASSTPADRILATPHASTNELADALDAEYDNQVQVVMLAELAERASQDQDISAATQGINTSLYRMLHHGHMDQPHSWFPIIVRTQLISAALIGRLAHPPVHDDTRAVVISTGLTDPSAAIVAVESSNPIMRKAAISSGHLTLTRLLDLQINDPDPGVSAQATLVISQRAATVTGHYPTTHRPS